MRTSSWSTGALLGAITSLPLMGLLFLGRQLAGLPFVPFDLFDALARVVPGGLITLFIETMVSVIRGLQLGSTSPVAKQIEQIMALGVTLVGSAIFGALIALARQRSPWSGRRIGLIGGFLLLLFVLVVEMAMDSLGNPWLAVPWLALLIAGWGAFLGARVEPVAPEEAEEEGERHRVSRRAFLTRLVGGSVALALVSWWLGRMVGPTASETGADQPLPESIAGTPTDSEAPPAGEIAAVPGTRPNVTDNETFYRTDINLFPPQVDGTTWALEVKGLFDRPRSLSLADIQAYPAVRVPMTLSCISNPVGGDLIGNAYWTGVRIRDVLGDLGMLPAATALQVEAADGFYESVGIRDLMDARTLLVYGMNGQTLNAVHGFPLRILIPNRYGMKQPKWITSIEAIDEPVRGYWVARGWSKEAYAQIVSVIDVVAKDEVVDGKVPVGGIAWAGDRGISRVEITVDYGPWEAARLIPPPGPLAWVHWRFEWPRVEGLHTFRVRATDGNGALQIERPALPHPDGATGYHSITVPM